eukprot:s954_g2.t1
MLTVAPRSNKTLGFIFSVRFYVAVGTNVGSRSSEISKVATVSQRKGGSLPRAEYAGMHVTWKAPPVQSACGLQNLPSQNHSLHAYPISLRSYRAHEMYSCRAA